jgi:hypothetical protein
VKEYGRPESDSKRQTTKSKTREGTIRNVTGIARYERGCRSV